MVIETVTKATTTTTTTSTMMTQQQQQQQIQIQQQQQQQQVQAVPTLTVDASKVTASGTGLHQANVTQETSFIVDGSQSGQFFITTTTTATTTTTTTTKQETLWTNLMYTPRSLFCHLLLQTCCLIRRLVTLLVKQVSNILCDIYTVFYKIRTPLFFCYNFSKYTVFQEKFTSMAFMITM